VGEDFKSRKIHMTDN